MEEEIKEFTNYANKYLQYGSMEKLKLNHTLRVLAYATRIANTLNLTTEDLYLAKLCALLHDISRFEQWHTYQSFVDAKTIDHGDYGEVVLKKDNLIRKFIKDPKYDEIIYQVIKNHNKYEVAKDLTPQELLLCNIVRDADKIDILYMYTTKEIYLNTNNEAFSEEVFQTLLSHKHIDRKIKKNKADALSISLGFVFDFNYPESLKILQEQEIMTQEINIYKEDTTNLEFTKQLTKIKKTIDEYIKERLYMLDKKYNAQEVEKNRYEEWKNKGYFKCDPDSSKEPFCIVIPPPNVTGKLHLGHAWDVTLQDIIIRYKRMQGYDCLWLPGMDHAGIATQAKVDARLKSAGIKPREMSREDWLKKAWSWKEEYATTIHEQWAKMGISVDYSKERFTLDDGLNQAVNKVFIDLYNKGLIYQGERIINWDPEQMTALSNEEVIYQDDKGAFYHLKYYIEDTDKYLDVATTRPETLFGDTAVAVNPSDKRYKALIGKKVKLPIVNKMIPIIADIHADPEFGTGCVKITPAHDPNDYEVGLRHNLERIVVMNKDATMNENALQYKGLTREKCREELVKDLTKQGLLIRIEPIVHSVGHSERSGVAVEPYLSKQWFVKMRPLADAVLKNQKNKDTKVNFVPPRYEKIMNHWMDITYDWCISRQLWWGHRIPAWYKGNEVKVGLTSPGPDWVQDKDVLDTWFSSALWPFSTLGWPNDTELLKRYYPTNVLVTGYDIIPFWVNRMTFQGLEFTKQRPFKDCLIHGLIRNKEGRKMSKSLGNGVDPMDVINDYGADALRFFLTTNSAPGMDLRYDEEKVKSSWNFINKLWNASRYTLMNIADLEKREFNEQDLTLYDKWILTKKNELIKNTIKNMDKYNFHNVGNELYSFIWEDYCDWYIELTKGNMTNTTKTVLLDTLTVILKLLHPFMPYVTEEIYQKLPLKDSPSIMISSYPTYNKAEMYKEDSLLLEKVLQDIVAIRNLKATNKITKEAKLMIDCKDQDLRAIYLSQLKINAENIVTTKPKDMLSCNYKSNLLDITYFFMEDKEVAENKLEEITKLEASIKRRETLLANPNYVAKAPANIVELDRQKLQEEKARLKILKD